MAKFMYSTDESKITELAGITLREYYSDLQAMIRAQKRANEQVERELGIRRSGHGLSRGHVIDAEVLGCAVVWPEDEEPMVAAPAIATVEDIRRFRPPDPPDNAVVLRELQRSRVFYELTGQKATVGFNGPVTVAALCLGLDRFYTLAAMDTGLAEELVRRATDGVIAWKRYHDAEMGISAQGELGAADDSASFLSPRLAGILSLPYLAQWYGAFPGYSGRDLHICGDSTHFLDRLGALHLSSFDLGEMVDLRRARALLPGTFLWRIADFRLIRDGDAHEIEQYIREQLDLGAPGERFGIHMEGWRGVPLSKARVVKEAVERYNRSHSA